MRPQWPSRRRRTSRSSREGRFGGLSGLRRPGRTRTIVPPSPQPPKEKAEEEQSTPVDAHCITQLVKPAVIVGGINRYIIPHEQIRQGKRHQGAMKNARLEICRLRLTVGRPNDKMENRSDHDRRSQDPEHPLHKPRHHIPSRPVNFSHGPTFFAPPLREQVKFNGGDEVGCFPKRGFCRFRTVQ
jgi:hypothetical protein